MTESILLSEAYLNPDRISQAASIISSGKKIPFPEDVFSEAKNRIISLKKEKQQQSQANKNNDNIKAALFLLVFGAMFIWLHPWPYYKYAAFEDTIEIYESFIRQHPRSDLAVHANKRLTELKEDPTWANVSGKRDVSAIRHYLSTYPKGKYVSKAHSLLEDIALEKWDAMANSRSVNELRAFIKEHSDSSAVSNAKARINQLYNDFSWIKNQNNIEAYSKFLELNPDTKHKSFLEKKIIDLEVAEIASNEHGALPKAQSVKSMPGSTTAEINIENKTGYELIIRYSGPDSKKITIPIGQKSNINLKSGDYTVAASVSALNVRNYVGTDTMKGGIYESYFYIESGMSFSGFRRGKGKRSHRNDDE